MSPETPYYSNARQRKVTFRTLPPGCEFKTYAWGVPFRLEFTRQLKERRKSYVSLSRHIDRVCSHHARRQPDHHHFDPDGVSRGQSSGIESALGASTIVCPYRSREPAHHLGEGEGDRREGSDLQSGVGLDFLVTP